jgi:hypothetical protein
MSQAQDIVVHGFQLLAELVTFRTGEVGRQGMTGLDGRGEECE